MRYTDQRTKMVTVGNAVWTASSWWQPAIIMIISGKYCDNYRSRDQVFNQKINVIWHRDGKAR